MVSNYRRGYATERMAIEFLKNKLGCFEAQRSAGSHSLIDVWGISKDGNVYAVQLKRVKTPRNMLGTLRMYSPPEDAVLPPNIHWMFWIWVDRKGWIKYEWNGEEWEKYYDYKD